MGLHFLLVITFCLSSILTGLIWTVQAVHYPGFLNVGAEHFPKYELLHKRRIFPLVGMLMILELIATGLFMGRMLPDYYLLTWTATILLLVIWIHTWAVAAPLHSKLSKNGYDTRIIEKLISTNWIRTIAWSARSFIYGWMIYQMLVG